VLDETSYLQALYLYLGAAGAFLLMAALLLTPAYPDPTITTFAPALIVALFESMINGVDAAQHAVKPLGFMLCLALVLSLLLRFTLFRKHSQAD
jgi:uncharacterized membrane protein